MDLKPRFLGGLQGLDLRSTYLFWHLSSKNKVLCHCSKPCGVFFNSFGLFCLFVLFVFVILFALFLLVCCFCCCGCNRPKNNTKNRNDTTKTTKTLFFHGLGAFGGFSFGKQKAQQMNKQTKRKIEKHK